MRRVERSTRFERSYQKLSPFIKKDFQKKIALFLTDNFVASLGTHKLHGGDYYAFELRDGFRVFFIFEGDTIVLVNVGPHDMYRRLSVFS